MSQSRFDFDGFTWKLIFMSGIFALSTGLSSTFVNVYLWKVNHSYIAIGWYNLCTYAMIPLVFAAVGFLRVLDWGWSLRLGIVAFVLFYATVLWFGEHVAKFPAMLGVLMGVAAGLYWFAFNLLSLRFTDGGTRDRFTGFTGVVGAAAGILAPPIAGYLITLEDRMGGWTGYHLIFGLSLGLFILAAMISLAFPLIGTESGIEIRIAVRALRKCAWRGVLVGCSLYGIREGVFLFLIGLLMYVATGSELALGEFLFVQSALSFASFLLMSRLVKPSNRVFALGVGAVLMAGAATLFLLPIRPILILVYGSAIALALPVFLVPLQSLIMDSMTALTPDGKAYPEHVVMREIFQNIGRITGVGAFLLLGMRGFDVHLLGRLAVGLGFVQLGTWLIIYLSGSGTFAMKGVHRLSARSPGLSYRTQRTEPPADR